MLDEAGVDQLPKERPTGAGRDRRRRRPPVADVARATKGDEAEEDGPVDGVLGRPCSRASVAILGPLGALAEIPALALDAEVLVAPGDVVDDKLLEACEREGCTESDDLARVDPDDPGNEERTLWGRHRVDYFEEIAS